MPPAPIGVSVWARAEPSRRLTSVGEYLNHPLAEPVVG